MGHILKAMAEMMRDFQTLFADLSSKLDALNTKVQALVDKDSTQP